MCNAWNHPPGCRCGWGGQGYSGHPPGGFSTAGVRCAVAIGSYQRFWYAPITSRTSYTTPNAHCPVCGAPVFFYESEYGGRVFFDELGPPWPKHPCTDHGTDKRRPQMRTEVARATPASIISAVSYSSGNLGLPAFQWQSDSWEPLINPMLRRINEITQVTGQAWGESLRFYVPHDHLNPRAPWLIRRRTSGDFEVTTIVCSKVSRHDLVPVRCPTFSSVNNAIAYARKHRFGTGVFQAVSSRSRPAGDTSRGSVGTSLVKREAKKSRKK